MSKSWVRIIIFFLYDVDSFVELKLSKVEVEVYAKPNIDEVDFDVSRLGINVVTTQCLSFQPNRHGNPEMT